MDVTITASPITSSPSCPVTRLPPELRKIIYEYYFDSMKTTESESHSAHIPEYQYYYEEDGEHIKWRCAKQSDGFQILKPYLSILHLSRVVRLETATKTYATAFTDVWFNLEIDGEVNDVKRMKGMFSQIRSVNKKVEFGLHFTISDHTRETFYQFIDSFFDMRATEDDLVPAFIRCKEDSEAETLMLSSTEGAKIEYTYKSLCKDCHRLWMFGTLARLDWSKFDFEMPPPLVRKSRLMDNSMDDPTRTRHCQDMGTGIANCQTNLCDTGDGIDIDLDSENEVIAFNSDDDNEAVYLNGAKEGLTRDEDDEDEGRLLESEHEGRQIDSEDDAFSLDGGDEDWW